MPTTDPPSFAEEAAFIAQLGGSARIAGVDEVGRGPFAGPVVAAAAVLDAESAAALIALGARDSKQLSARRREAISEAIRAWRGPGRVGFALGAASVGEIARLNILGAADLAMRRALARLEQPADAALIDGARSPTGLEIPSKALIGGDRRSIAIAAASILAKCCRDRLMRRLARRWPAYGWETNVGYGGAAKHRDAILSHGLTPHHRAQFCAKLLAGSPAVAARSTFR